jgi:hypothetical protein
MADEKTLGEKLQSVPSRWLYFILFVACSIPLWFTIPVPNDEAKAAIDFYNMVKEIPEGSTILVASDWTNGTRGESGGEFKALLRILMRKKVKFAIYSTADPQAPQVAKDVIRGLNAERREEKQEPYKQWVDYVSVGYFPDAEAAANSIQNNVRSAFKDKKDFDENGRLTFVLESPVLAKVQKVQDFPVLIVVTASKTSNITIERVTQTPLLLMVTGVMGPESAVYYASGQVKGLVAGLKGVYDVETLMQKDFPGMTNLDNGAKYYPTLHVALLLLIIAVIVGNVGMVLSRRKA